MPAATVRIEGMDRLLRDLDPKRWDRVLRTAMKGGIGVIRAEIKEYPPKTEANQPRAWGGAFSISTKKAHNTWYQRGWGTKRIRKDGGITGYMTSEELGKQWTKGKVRRTSYGYLGTTGNRVTYARWVQDADKQAHFHKARGWKTVQGVVKSKGPAVRRLFEQVIRKAVR